MRKPHNKSQNRQKPSRQNPARAVEKGRERSRQPDSRPEKRSEKRPDNRQDHRPDHRHDHRPAKSRLSVMPDQVMIYGRHPAAAALANPARKIRAIYVTEDAQSWIQADHGAALARRNLTPIVVDRADMADALPPQDKHVHQGVVIVALPLSPPSLDEWLDDWLDNRLDDNQNDGQAAKQTVLVMLDQITDGRNIGAIMRSALAFGAHAIITTDRNTPTETGAMLRAASGAAEHMPLIRVVNLSRAITLLQDHHFIVAGLDARGTADLTGCANEDRLVLVLGAEGSGLRHLTREKVDQLIRIPMSDHAESLNVSNAAAVALYAATAGQFKNAKND